MMGLVHDDDEDGSGTVRAAKPQWPEDIDIPDVPLSRTPHSRPGEVKEDVDKEEVD
jgi:hypothetical protein